MMAVLGHLDPTSDRAPFRQIADQLRDFTLHLAPGARLPSEAGLMTHYGVARMTVRSAVQELVREGLVEARQGAGVFRSTSEDGLTQAAADMAHRDDLARDVAREWAENRRHPTPEWEPVGAGLAVLLDRLVTHAALWVEQHRGRRWRAFACDEHAHHPALTGARPLTGADREALGIRQRNRCCCARRATLDTAQAAALTPGTHKNRPPTCPAKGGGGPIVLLAAHRV